MAGNIKRFIEHWKDKGDEKSETQAFWLELFRDVLEFDALENHSIIFEKRVELEHTSFIDAYISLTRVIIEQKSRNIDLTKSAKQSDGTMKTPFEQAKRYSDWLPASERPNWIVICNFQEFRIHDMEEPKAAPEIIHLADLEKHKAKLQFLIDPNAAKPKEIRKLEISVKAGKLVGKLYDALLKRYKNPETDSSLKSLNVLCVRIVFILYAEDSGLFKKSAFHDYMKKNSHNSRRALMDLFTILSQDEKDRDPYIDSDLMAFPYVNGGLFNDNVNIEIPQLDGEPLDIILHEMSEGFDWSGISPTIFGAVFESTLNPETRRKGGMHYTSIENIHRVIDPLFLNDLKAELAEIMQMPKNTLSEISARTRKFNAFQKKLGSLTFLDPACGSGNFLTETYLCLRRLENQILFECHLQREFASSLEDVGYIRVSIKQFYGIEINDFAVSVARTALWIAEAQMMDETKKIVEILDDFLPLKSYNHIVEGNALRMDWGEIVPPEKLNYIMGNPPFRGARIMDPTQKVELNEVFNGWNNAGNLDYVSCWYKKAADLMKNTTIKAALVSTNSIAQGDSVAILWKPLFDAGIHIDFARRTFIWNSEASDKAHVHCVIIGFSSGKQSKNCIIYDNEQAITVRHINAYLVDAPDIFVGSRQNPICSVPEIGMGNQPIDNGNYLFKKDEMEAFIKKEPQSAKYFHAWYGADEFINRRPRYCLYLGNCTPNELRKMPECLKRIEAVKEYRLKSSRASTVKLAEKPTRFQTENMPEGNYIVIPKVSSEKRIYIPMGFMSPDILCGDAVFLLPDANLYHLGILESSLHMAWMRTVAGRLKSDYRYSKDIVYNNFIWPSPNDKQKSKIEAAAQAILDARDLYPDSSLADLYDPLTMPAELLKAHRANDEAVLSAYGFPKDITEEEIVAKLFERLCS